MGIAHFRNKGRPSARFTAALAATIFSLSLIGCGGTVKDDSKDDDATAPAYKTYLYMTDTCDGGIYAYDPSDHSSAATSIASTTSGSTGEIVFHAGTGYVAVGYGSSEGVYHFDPSAANPSFSKLGASVAAQYFAFFSDTRAYVSTYGNGLYSFDPTHPSAGLTQVASLSATAVLQDLVVAADGYLYVADNANGRVYKLNPASGDALVATIATNAGGTTGLAAGACRGQGGVFVANTDGSIDFIQAGLTADATAELVTDDSIFPGRLAQLPDGKLVATGYDSGYVNHSYLVTIAATTAAVTELTTQTGGSFGSLDIAVKDGLVYIPSAVTADYTNYKSCVYVLDSSGAQQSYSPVYVMGSSAAATSAKGISNIAFYE